MSKQAKLREYRTFVTRAVRQPGTVGAVLPTSEYVARAVAEVVPASGTPTVLELGPGTGALSGALRERLPAGSDHLAVEIDPELVRYLNSTKPWLEVIEGDARHLVELLAAANRTQVDAVISSIPWTLLPADQQRALLREVSKVLTKEGVFTTVTYVTTLWRANTIAFTEILRETFEEVLPRSTVWRNVPPARVYVCRRPRH
ncbi:methyltransferase domain-containing protein [Saccharopolyspora sp. NFXS83]|uniref:class I SAM-dependent methyltransferase n=1 Tax=Saccharopolyspora sp. NFXS83 TaxID=2993560 RepID=UPI00224B2BF5|nr:methyltransferase domain-containing protein [Saccharopolyspora sp. NFXS83]MCX2729031.1 methyltransferase domain-containing protein [Saccharopolyspora sp. NFXS83]